MVTALTPLAIILGGALAAAFIFASVWKNFVGHISGFGSFYERELDLADMQIKPHELGFVVVTIAALAWIGMIVLLRPGVFVGIGCVPIVLGITAYGVRFYLRMRITKNIKLFREQFESVLRSLASGVRVGLGLRQALLLVAEQSRNPAKKELNRVIGAANLGKSLFDGLDEMGRRMNLAETQMFSRVIRIQSQSGGDLAEVLESLASTIRDRRRLELKIKALTSQSRATAWLLGLLPVGLCAFIVATQPVMREAILTTNVGKVSLILGFALDGVALFCLVRLTKLDA